MCEKIMEVFLKEFGQVGNWAFGIPRSLFKDLGRGAQLRPSHIGKSILDFRVAKQEQH